LTTLPQSSSPIMANPAADSSMMMVPNTVVQQQKQTLASPTSNQTQARPPASMPTNSGSQSIYNGGNQNHLVQECAPRGAQEYRDALNINVGTPGVDRQSNPLPPYPEHAAMTVRSNDSMAYGRGTRGEKNKSPKKGVLVSCTTFPPFCSSRLTVPAQSHSGIQGSRSAS
jgi:hypothetical protein